MASLLDNTSVTEMRSDQNNDYITPLGYHPPHMRAEHVNVNPRVYLTAPAPRRH